MATWLFTNTCYGTWLPGDARGSVTSVRDLRPGDPPSPARREHDVPGTPWERVIPGLHRSARRLLNGPPVSLTRDKAETIVAQFQETCRFRAWHLEAVSVMWNHFHAVVDIHEDRPAKVLADLKAYASRALNWHHGRPESGTWWTTKGSARLLRDAAAVGAAVQYVLERQPNPLVTWAPGAHASGSISEAR